MVKNIIISIGTDKLPTSNEEGNGLLSLIVAVSATISMSYLK